MLITDATRLPRFMQCHGSRLMASVLPEDDDRTARDEGTAAHWLAQQWFNGAQPTAGEKAPNGFVITAEMVEHVGSYLKEIEPGSIETVTTFATDRWRVNTRADHIVMRDGCLTVDDFKYGWRAVSPEHNWTLLAHAIGYCLNNNLQPAVIAMRIHQPRPYHPDGKLREWRITYADLCDYYAQLDSALSNPTDELRSGPYCAGCHAEPTCPAWRAASMNAIDVSTLAFYDDIAPDALAYEIDTLRYAQATLKSRLDALEELATHRIKSGELIGDYGLQPQLGNYRWKAGLTGEALTAATGIQCVKTDAITPAEAKRRGVPEPVIKSLTERPQLGLKLVKENPTNRAKRLLGKPE